MTEAERKRQLDSEKDRELIIQSKGLGTCPRCHGTDLAKSGNVRATASGHVKCNSCGTVSWLCAIGRTNGFCGNPQEHFVEGGAVSSAEETRRSE